MGRSRRELSNAYLLAKFRFDTAENEPCQVCPISRNAGGRRPDRERIGRRVREPPGRGREARAGMRQTLQGSFSAVSKRNFLQVNMRLKILAEIYTMHSFVLL